MATPTFHALEVKHVESATRDAVVITFDVPPNLSGAFTYVQGQYLTLRATVDGEDLRRSYSICSAVQDKCLRVAVKRVAGGIFSNWAAEHLLPGATIDVMPPDGNFHLPLDVNASRHIVAIASGSGITPIFSIVKSALLAEPATRVTLIYGNRSSNGVMFREEIAALKDAYLERFNLIWIMSREPQDIPLFNGRIDHEKCSRIFTQWIAPETVDAAFICGPEDMMLAASEALCAKGIDKSRIKFELFGTLRKDGKPRVAKSTVLGNDCCEVVVVQDGLRRTFTMPKNLESLVDAGIKAGIEMPYACKGGVCSTCRGKVVEGEVDMDINFALEDYEVARGFVLCCQSYPVTDKLVIDFDQDHAHL